MKCFDIVKLESASQNVHCARNFNMLALHLEPE